MTLLADELRKLTQWRCPVVNCGLVQVGYANEHRSLVIPNLPRYNRSLNFPAFNCCNHSFLF